MTYYVPPPPPHRCRYLGAHGLNTTRASDDNTPVVFVSPASGRADGKHHASNWYDVIEFGHLDALLAGYGVWGLQCLADIYQALGDHVAATRTREIHQQAVIDFNKVFWNASSASCVTSCAHDRPLGRTSSTN
jgi:hypothetical protein